MNPVPSPESPEMGLQWLGNMTRNSVVHVNGLRVGGEDWLARRQTARDHLMLMKMVARINKLDGKVDEILGIIADLDLCLCFADVCDHRIAERILALRRCA